MKIHRAAVGTLSLLGLLLWGAPLVRAQDKAASSTVQVHMVITDQAFSDNSEVAVLRPETLEVKQGKNALKVDHLIPAQGENAALSQPKPCACPAVRCHPWTVLICH